MQVRGCVSNFEISNRRWDFPPPAEHAGGEPTTCGLRTGRTLSSEPDSPLFGHNCYQFDMFCCHFWYYHEDTKTKRVQMRKTCQMLRRNIS